MIGIVDVGYRHEADGSTTGCVAALVALGWAASEPETVITVTVAAVAPYEPGKFYRRELPCLVAGLDAVRAAGCLLDAVLIDGNVRLDPEGSAGLGRHLFDKLDTKVPVIGVAKRLFQGLDALPVLRGTSTRPLWITAAGIDESVAADLVLTMAGPYRLPTLIKLADTTANSCL